MTDVIDFVLLLTIYFGKMQIDLQAEIINFNVIELKLDYFNNSRY